MQFSPDTVASLVIAISFAAGLNVYATLLTLGGMARLGWLTLPSGLEPVAGPWIMGISAVLFAAEFVADKIPALDLIWNAAQTFVRVPVAALIAYGATTHLSPGMQALVTLLGAVVATIAHGSKLAIRGAVTPSPEPVSNIALSSVEDLGAIGLTWMAMHHPVEAALVAGALMATVGVAIWSIAGVLRRLWMSLSQGLPGRSRVV